MEQILYVIFVYFDSQLNCIYLNGKFRGLKILLFEYHLAYYNLKSFKLVFFIHSKSINKINQSLLI